VVCAIIGVVALIVGIIYLTVPIHQLPGFIPGGHPGGGTYHKRGALMVVIGLVFGAAAAVLLMGMDRPTAGAATPGRSSGSEVDGEPSGDAPATDVGRAADTPVGPSAETE